MKIGPVFLEHTVQCELFPTVGRQATVSGQTDRVTSSCYSRYSGSRLDSWAACLTDNTVGLADFELCRSFTLHSVADWHVLASVLVIVLLTRADVSSHYCFTDTCWRLFSLLFYSHVLACICSHYCFAKMLYTQKRSSYDASFKIRVTDICILRAN